MMDQVVVAIKDRNVVDVFIVKLLFGGECFLLFMWVFRSYLRVNTMDFPVLSYK